VGPAEEPQVLDRGPPPLGQGDDVVELQAGGGFASPAVRLDLGAAAAVALVDERPDLRRDRPPGPPLPGRGVRIPELPLLEPFDQRVEGALEHLLDVARWERVAEQFLCSSEFVVHRARNRDLEGESLRNGRDLRTNLRCTFLEIDMPRGKSISITCTRRMVAELSALPDGG